MPAASRPPARGLLASLAALLLASLALAESGLPSARRDGLVRPRAAPVVREEEWARGLVEALGLAEALPPGAGPAARFSLLCPGERPTRIAALPEAVRVEPAGGADATVRLRTPPVRAGRYRLSVHGSGAGAWSLADRPIGILAPGSLTVDVRGEPVRLAGGPAELSARLGDGARVDRVELLPWTTSCIAPAGGWKAGRPLRFGAKARTMVLALDALERLPIEGDPLRIEAEGFRALRPDAARLGRWLGVPTSADRWVEAIGPRAEFLYRLELDEGGLHTILARIHGGQRQIWSVDGRLHAAVLAGAEAPRFAWTEVATVWLEAGRHTLHARLPRGAGIDVVRVLRRRTDGAGFLAALGSLGLVEGAPAQAVDAAAARRNLEALEALERAGSRAPELAAVEGALEALYERPLSPVLPEGGP